VEHGFIDKWVNDYARYVEFTHNASSQCANSTQSQVGYLSLDQAQGAFWLLIAGLLFSILILSIECIIRLLWGWVSIVIKILLALPLSPIQKLEGGKDGSTRERDFRLP
jgi:hypothetical protein